MTQHEFWFVWSWLHFVPCRKRRHWLTGFRYRQTTSNLELNAYRLIQASCCFPCSDRPGKVLSWVALGCDTECFACLRNGMNTCVIIVSMVPAFSDLTWATGNDLTWLDLFDFRKDRTRLITIDEYIKEPRSRRIVAVVTILCACSRSGQVYRVPKGYSNSCSAFFSEHTGFPHSVACWTASYYFACFACQQVIILYRFIYSLFYFPIQGFRWHRQNGIQAMRCASRKLDT